MALKFDNYEYHPCVEFEKLNGHRFSEQVTTQEFADWEKLGSEFDVPRRFFWAVYGHIANAGVDCVADCPDEESAILITRVLNLNLNSMKE